MIRITSLENPTGKTVSLTADGTFTAGDGQVLLVDGGAADRNFDPSGDFPAYWEVKIVNTGANNIVFDSAASAQTILPGYMGIFVFDGTDWR